MTRVSSFGHGQAMIQGLLRNQVRLAESQMQVNTGRKAQEFRGLAADAGTLMGAKSLKSRTDAYQRVITNVQGRLDVNDVQLDGVIEQANELRDMVLRAIGDQEAILFDENLTSTYAFIATSLNTEVSGVHIFAGSKTDVSPINARSLNDLQALPTAADAFDNDRIPATAMIAENVQIPYGLLASDIAGPLFDVIRDIADFHDGPNGPLNGKLTAVQRTFLETELQRLDAAIDVMHKNQVENGVRFERIDTINQQHTDQNLFLDSFIADLEDVNLAEAISNLENNKTALQASYSVVGQLGELSLINYLR